MPADCAVTVVNAISHAASQSVELEDASLLDSGAGSGGDGSRSVVGDVGPAVAETWVGVEHLVGPALVEPWLGDVDADGLPVVPGLSSGDIRSEFQLFFRNKQLEALSFIEYAPGNKESRENPVRVVLGAPCWTERVVLISVRPRLRQRHYKVPLFAIGHAVIECLRSFMTTESSDISHAVAELRRTDVRSVRSESE